MAGNFPASVRSVSFVSALSRDALQVNIELSFIEIPGGVTYFQAHMVYLYLVLYPKQTDDVRSSQDSKLSLQAWGRWNRWVAVAACTFRFSAMSLCSSH